jgi:hypothetical protein
MLVTLSLLAILIVIMLVLINFYAPDPSQEGGPVPSDRNVGASAADFWANYPLSNPHAGQPVQHPSWLLAQLVSCPIMILVHQEGCVGCALQLPICNDVNASHPGNLTYVTLLDGRDDLKLSECITTYDPDGAAHYVPLTILVTLRSDAQGNDIIAWHSWEGVISEAELTSWVDDTIDHWPITG